MSYIRDGPFSHLNLFTVQSIGTLAPAQSLSGGSSR